ncbi:hypothetical protein IAU60_004937 [Kwoniella sp. DSM 27419]
MRARSACCGTGTPSTGCFLSSSWHIHTKGGFVGSVFGVFFLCMAIELVRRGMREYDRRLILATRSAAALAANDNKATVAGAHPFHYQPSWVQQITRGFAYGSQFSASFLVMLLGMYYNGYILIFGIFLGHTVGYIVFGRDTCTASVDHVASGNCC